MTRGLCRKPNYARAVIRAMASGVPEIAGKVAAYYGRIAGLASDNRLPTIYAAREGVDAGGLMSYGANLPDLSRKTALYVDKILKGAKPADLPVQQPTKFELVINLKTAKTLGIEVTPTLLAGADEVVE